MQRKLSNAPSTSGRAFAGTALTPFVAFNTRYCWQCRDQFPAKDASAVRLECGLEVYYCPTHAPALAKPVPRLLQKNRKTVVVRFCYTEHVIPPRCRKPRPTFHEDGEIEIGITEVTGDDAPVALRAHGTFIHRDDASYAVEYRWWKGRLWTSLNVDGNGEPRGRYASEDNWDWPVWEPMLDLRLGGKNQSYDFGYHEPHGLSREEVTRGLRAFAREHLIVDGIAYRPRDEPRYVVQTFGFGCNHGGTGVFVTSAYNSNIKRSHYFSLLDREAAIALGTEIATRRKDTNSLPMQISGPTWEIHIPEAVRIRSRR
ncbi:hypothetical protein [Paraburkholderia xenovorans]|jgi:hypothetical protein